MKLPIAITRRLASCLLIFPLMALSACSDDNPEMPETAVERTVIVYMAADNSLGSAGNDERDLQEMSIAAQNGDLCGNRLLVYHASRVAQPELIEITPTERVTLKTYDYSPSSVTIERMTEVFNDSKNFSPAKSYGLVLWSHATGWIQNGVAEPDATTNSFGEERGRYMNVTSLAKALDGQKFDYVYFDCCYMANVESLYQLRDVTPIAVASTTELPADGMPYDKTLRYLMSDSPDLYSAAQTTFGHYDSLEGAQRTCTISVIDMTAIGRLADATRVVFMSGDAPGAGYVPQPFMISGCYLYDLKDYIEAFDCRSDLKESWREAFDDVVKLSLATPAVWNRLSLKRANGLSCYILNSSADSAYKGYNQLDWWTDVASFIF